MVTVEFLQDYKCCHKKGETFKALPHFAQTLIENGIAKRVDRPQKHKMIESPQKAKGNIASPYLD